MTATISYRNSHLYIIRPIGAFNALIDLCTQIYEHFHGSIIFKKVDQMLYNQLSVTPLFRIDTTGQELFEEETFPEHILKLERLFSPTPATKPLLHPFLKKVQRFERQAKLWPERIASWEHLVSNPGFSGLLGQNSAKYQSYAHVIQEACSGRTGNGRYKTCAYYDERGTLHGLYVSELLAQGIMGLYCAVSDRSAPGVTEWMDYDFFHQLFREEIQTLYLGGSETAGVHAYVQKLLPVHPTYHMHPFHMYPGNGTVD